VSAIRSWSPGAESRTFLSLSLARIDSYSRDWSPDTVGKWTSAMWREIDHNNHGEPTAANFSAGPRAHPPLLIASTPRLGQGLIQLKDGT
jgi:hypothetical protein